MGPTDARPDPSQVPALPHTWRPVGPRVVGVTLSVMLAVSLVAAGVALGPEIRARFTGFEIGTLLFVALLAGASMYALLRSRVVATEAGLTVVNGYRRRDLAWEQVVAVHLRPGAPWVTLDVADGTVVSVMAIQSSDGPRSREATRALRRLVAAHGG